jgi:hypothetical protein
MLLAAVRLQRYARPIRRLRRVGVEFQEGFLDGEPNFIVRRDPDAPREAADRHAGSLTTGAGAVWATVPDEDLLVRYQLKQRQRAEIEVGARPIGVQVAQGRAWVAASASSTLGQVGANRFRIVGKPLRVPLNPLPTRARRSRTASPHGHVRSARAHARDSMMFASRP